MPGIVRRWVNRPLWTGLAGVAILAVVYPLIAAHTQHPLALFVVPMLAAAALGTAREALVVSIAALLVATLEGTLERGLDGGSLAVRLSILVISAAVAVAVAAERHRRQVEIDDQVARSVLFEAFQTSLVPAPIPPPGVAVRVRYLPGDARLRLGGDFFDAIPLPSQALGYVIGDVCGHGPRAAAFGAAVRSGWKTLAIRHPDDPCEWIQGLDAAFFRLGRHGDTYVTLNAGIFRPSDGSVTFVSAGHPWPVVVGPTVEMVRPTAGPPLGVVVDPSWHASEVRLDPAAALLLYTDGLTENPTGGHHRDDGEQRLLHYLTTATDPLDLDRLLGHFGPRGFEDDVAVMTIGAR